jgi:hypothetical protein
MGEEVRSPIARQVSASDGRLRSPRRYCGPSLWTPSEPHDSRLGGVSPSALKLRWARRRGAQSYARCPLQMDGKDLLGDTVGPGSGRPRHLVTHDLGELVLLL